MCRAVRGIETSTYIVKLPSGTLRDIVENECLTTLACRALLPDDDIIAPEIGTLEGMQQRALLVSRFDRPRSGAKRHFEEFNRLLGKRSGDDKYDASYDDMAALILKTPACRPADAWKLYRRVLVCFLTGNTDAHLKNFAMFHTPDRLRLTPADDLVAAALYPEYRQLALAIGNASNLVLESLRPKHLVALGKSYGLDAALLTDTVKRLDGNRKAAEKAVTEATKRVGDETLGKNLLDLIERRFQLNWPIVGAPSDGDTGSDRNPPPARNEADAEAAHRARQGELADRFALREQREGPSAFLGSGHP